MDTNKDYNRNNDQENSEDDQLRPNTMNEVIREVSGDPDADLNEIGNSRQDLHSNMQTGSGGAHDADLTQGMSYDPNDASAVRSGGTTDMDDQTAGGSGLNTGIRHGMGTNITTKRNVTGSDFDGQNSTS
jgi:hypothetical protein